MAERKAVTIYVGDAKSLVAASAEAKAAIKAVQDQASKKSGLDKFPTLGGNITTSLAAAIPVVTGLSGALGGLAASATAAAGGAGAVAVGGIGALVVGLGSIAAVVKPAIGNFKKVTTALDAYNLTLAKHGVTAKQATAAQQKLNAVVSQNGGADVLKAAKSWDALGESFQKLTGPATSTMFKTFTDGLGALKSLLPTVAGIANQSMAALSKALQGPLKIISGAEFKGILKSLGDTFAKSIGPAVKAASLVFLAFSRIAQAAGPYVVELAKGIERLAQGFANATKDPTKLNGIIGTLVSNTKSWLNLTTAVGRLIFDVFKQGVASGQGMVDNLTQVVNKWDAWVNSASGSQSVQNFFRESAQFARELFSALGPILQAVSAMSVGALPVYVSLLSKFKNILGPLTYGLVAYKAALTIATAATKAAQALGGKPLFGGAVATVPSAAAPATTTGALGSIRPGASSLVSKGAQGLMIGTVGTIASQAIGAAIHGAAGAAVKAIGTDASIGAGFGSIFGPAGMAGGALIGGLVGSVKTFITDHVGDEGKKFAAAFTADLPNQISKRTTTALATATTHVSQTAKAIGASKVGTVGRSPGSPLFGQGAALDQQQQHDFFNQGFAAGQAVIQGMKSVKDPSSTILLSDFLTKLKALPPQVQPEAAKVMVSFATGLQQAGKIPLKGLRDIIKGLEKQIPGFGAYLGSEGNVMAQVFAKALMLSPATATLKNTLAGYRKQFGDMAISTKITGQNIDQNISTAMSHLRTIVANSSGQTRKDAVAEYNKLHDQAVAVFSSMGNKVQASIRNMSTAIKDGSASAAKVAGQNLGDFASNVGQAMNNGVLSVGQGMKLIIDNTNKALKEMGQKQLSPIQVGAMTLGTAKQKNLKAGGGYIGNPGEKGRDNVPIVVGRGEAVLNHDQQRVVNGALSAVGIGGLPSLFSRVNRPHYMAGGGIVTASMYGGPTDHTVSQTDPRGYKGDNLLQHPDSYAELNMGTALGGLPYLAPLNVTYGGKTARLFKRDIGAGGPGLGGHTRAIDLWYKAAQAIGLPGLGNVSLGGNPNVKISGGALGALSSITAPKVSGGGFMATIAHAAMGILAKGANAYLATKTPSANVSIFGGGAKSGPGGLATFEGVTMAKWIANELVWATQHGWHGQPTSGYRPGFDPHAPGGSEHALINYPGGAVDFGGMTGDPAAYATKLALVQLAARLNYPGPRLMMPVGFRDDGHLSGDGHAKGGFVGSFKNGGVAPRDGFAYVHKGETMIPAFASGGPVGGKLSGTTAAISPAYMQGLINNIVRGSMSSGLIYPIDAALAKLNQLAATAKNPIKVNLEIAKLTQLQNWRTAITSLRSDVKGLAQQAAQAWNAIQTGKINATHTAAINAIAGGSDSTTLAAMQAQDTATANAQQLSGLQDTLTTDQALAAHSGGQTHLDALKQVEADQAAIDAFNRQQTENQLQANIDAATKKADDAQTIALNGLDAQTQDYQNGLDAQFAALTNNLTARKLSYAQWAKDVDEILAQYGLSVSTDAGAEGAVSAGPGVAAKIKIPKPKKGTASAGLSFGGHRAGGGGVRPGYVYRVGENGPEDVMFGQNGTVMTAAQSRGSGGPTVHIGQANFTGTRAARAFADRLAYRAAIGTA